MGIFDDGRDLGDELEALEAVVAAAKPRLRSWIRVDAREALRLIDLIRARLPLCVKAVRWYARRSEAEGRPTLGPLPDTDEIFAALDRLDRFVSKRRADILQFGGATIVAKAELDSLLEDAVAALSPWAHQFREYRRLMPEAEAARPTG